MKDADLNGTSMKPGSEKKARKELLLLLLLLLPVGIGAFALADGLFPSNAHLTTSQSLSENLIKPSSGGLLPLEQNQGLPVRQIPKDYKSLGTVDERFTLAVEPQTGQLLINDSMGSIGTNNTSVEGLRAELARDMLGLEEYAEQNKKSMPRDAYEWLKKVAKTGMALAFGAPGIPPHMQPEIKLKLLAELHHISANPSESIMHTDKFLELEKTFARLDEAYYNTSSGTTLASKGGYLEPDPFSPYSATTLDYAGSGTLTGTLANATLSPSVTDMAASSSPYNYVEASYSSGTTTVAATSNTTTRTAASSTTAATSTDTTTAATSATTAASSGSSMTVSGYYDALLGTDSTKTAATSTSSGSTGGATNTGTTTDSGTSTATTQSSATTTYSAGTTSTTASTSTQSTGLVTGLVDTTTQTVNTVTQPTIGTSAF